MGMGKIVAARTAARLVLSRNPEIVGVGTGSTVGFFIEELSASPKAMGMKYVASSLDTARKLASRGLVVLDPSVVESVDIYIDGADEVDPAGRMVKGRGAAHLAEKMLAYRSKTNIFIVDESKLVSRLGEKKPVPISVLPEAIEFVLRSIGRLGYRAEVRSGSCKDGPCIDDNGFIVVDVWTGPMKNPENVELQLKSIPGVVETGLFIGLTDLVIVGRSDGRIEEFSASRTRGLHL